MHPADLEKSFEAAARHLFRHLHAAAALRSNPLVSWLFVQYRQPGFRPAADALVRGRILEIAAAYRSELTEAGFGSQALRQYEIVASICSAEHYSKTARRLGLSIRQYYRDRRAICMHIARLLGATRSVNTACIALDDPLQLVLRRAASLVDQGFAEKSIEVLEKVVTHTESAYARVAALLGISRAQIQFGNVDRAARSFESAERLFECNLSSMSAFTTLRDFISLVGVEVAVASGRDGEAAMEIGALAARQREGLEDSEISRGLALEVLLESCSCHLMIGNFAQARSALSEALHLARQTAYVSPESRAYLAVFAAACSEDVWSEPSESLSLNREALRVSVSVGSARGASYATYGLMRAYLRLGNEDQAYRWFNYGLQIARSMDGTKALLSAALAGAALLSTRHWREVGSLLIEGKDLAHPGTLKLAQMRGALGVYLARSGKLREALEQFSFAEGLAQRLHNRRQTANMLRERSLVLHRLCRLSESSECIRAAVALAEGGTSALSLYQTYSAAAKILADDQTLRMAKRLRTSISEGSRKKHA